MFRPFSTQIDWSVLHCGDADWCHRCTVWWSAYVLFNKHTHHIINFEVPHVSSLIKKYTCRPPDRASMAPISIATMQDTSVQNNCLQVSKLPLLEVTDKWKLWLMEVLYQLEKVLCKHATLEALLLLNVWEPQGEDQVTIGTRMFEGEESMEERGGGNFLKLIPGLCWYICTFLFHMVSFSTWFVTLNLVRIGVNFCWSSDEHNSNASNSSGNLTSFRILALIDSFSL